VIYYQEVITMAPLRVLMMTANVGACFEQPKEMMQPWLGEFLGLVDRVQPQFIALHCQEVGGKDYEESMQHVEHFMKSLLVLRGTLVPYDRYRVFLDEEYTTAEKFTALGNLYFIHEDVQDVQMWDFEDKKFVDVKGKEEHAGDIENVTTKEKSKFPQEFFPEENGVCKWSRKGFMRTRWCLNGTQFDMVNIHLFHDASNLMAMDGFPSVYTTNRKRALEHTLDRFHNDGMDKLPFFLFGDFNFRLDTAAVVEKLTAGCSKEDSGETKKFLDGSGATILEVSKKAFTHANHHDVFIKDNGNWLHEFDKENGQFGDRLQEFPIKFPPSYPFEEGQEGKGNQYMKTRCPSWCDRILMNAPGKELVQKSGAEVKYELLGLETRMGDHKPIYLECTIDF